MTADELLLAPGQQSTGVIARRVIVPLDSVRQLQDPQVIQWLMQCAFARLAPEGGEVVLRVRSRSR